MTATPESLLDEVMAAVALLGRDAVVEGYYQDALAESVRQAVEAYGRACRIAELHAAWDELVGGEVVVGGYLDTRIAELEQEGG